MLEMTYFQRFSAIANAASVFAAPLGGDMAVTIDPAWGSVEIRLTNAGHYATAHATLTGGLNHGSVRSHLYTGSARLTAGQNDLMNQLERLFREVR